MKIEIRPLRTTENDLIYKQLIQLFLEMYTFLNKTGLSQNLAPNGEVLWLNSIKKFLGKLNVVYIAMNDGEVIGFCSGNIRLNPSFLSSQKIGYLSQIYITPSYRNLNLGKALSLEVENWLIKNKVKQIGLEVLIKNEDAMRFWSKMGYTTEYVMMKKFNDEKV